MLHNQNPWKQYLFLLCGAIFGLAGYLLARTYSWADVVTFLKYTTDLYNMHVYVRIPLFLLGGALVISIVVYLLIKAWECARGTKQQKTRVKSYVSEEEYERQTKEITEQELRKLVNSVEYRRALEQKGDALQNWNWQTAERLHRENAFKSGAKTDSILVEEEKAAASA